MTKRVLEKFTIAEISAVTKPAQAGALAVIIKNGSSDIDSLEADLQRLSEDYNRDEVINLLQQCGQAYDSHMHPNGGYDAFIVSSDFQRIDKVQRIASALLSSSQVGRRTAN